MKDGKSTSGQLITLRDRPPPESDLTSADHHQLEDALCFLLQDAIDALQLREIVSGAQIAHRPRDFLTCAMPGTARPLRPVVSALAPVAIGAFEGTGRDP